MKSQATSGILRTKYTHCGQIKQSPTRVFDWKLRKEEAPSAGKPTCVFVFHNATGEKLPVYTSLAHTLQCVKEQLSASVTIPPQMMKLSFQGQLLRDDCTLVSYGISHGNCLHLTCAKGSDSSASAASHRRIMGINVHCIDDSPRPILARLRICARPSDKVLEVKLQLEAQTGVTAGAMRITLGGRTLANEQTLIECGVDESKVLQLVFPFGPGDVMSSASLKRNDHFATGSAAVERLFFPVTVKEVWPAGKSRHVGLTTDSTIRSLKDQLAEWSGIIPEKQLLLHRGRVLQDDLTASYYNLEGGASLDLAIVGGVKPVLKEVQKPPPQEQRRRSGGGPRRTVFFAAAPDKSVKADYKGSLENSRKSRITPRSLTTQLVHDEMAAIMQVAAQAEDQEEMQEQPELSAPVSPEEKDKEPEKVIPQEADAEYDAVKSKAEVPAKNAEAEDDPANSKAEVATLQSEHGPGDAAAPVSQMEDSPSHDGPHIMRTTEGEEQHSEVQLSTNEEQALLGEEREEGGLKFESGDAQPQEDVEALGGKPEKDRLENGQKNVAGALPHNWHKKVAQEGLEEKIGPGDFEHPDHESDEEDEKIDFTARRSEKPQVRLGACGSYYLEGDSPKVNAAATKIQSILRGRKSRATLKKRQFTSTRQIDEEENSDVEPVTSSSLIQEQGESRDAEPVASSSLSQEQEESKDVGPTTEELAASGDGRALSDEVGISKLEDVKDEHSEAEVAEAEANPAAPADSEHEPA